MQQAFEVRRLQDSDRPWVVSILQEHWGSTKMVSRGKLFDVSTQPGFVAVKDGTLIGLVTYMIDGGQCEVGLIHSLVEGIGVGSALLDAVRSAAVAAGCRRVWLVTTNDNIHALHFYQKRGFTLVGVYPNALEESRKLKPQIPRIGMNGIPLRDEIEMEMVLDRVTP